MGKEGDPGMIERGGPSTEVRWECGLCHKVYSFKIKPSPALKPSGIDPEECFDLAMDLTLYLHLRKYHAN